jgi:hypothetical protein
VKAFDHRRPAVGVELAREAGLFRRAEVRVAGTEVELRLAVRIEAFRTRSKIILNSS